MTTTTESRIITTTPERRQIAQRLHFPVHLASHIDFDRVAETARQLGADFEVRHEADGAILIVLFWVCEENER